MLEGTLSGLLLKSSTVRAPTVLLYPPSWHFHMTYDVVFTVFWNNVNKLTIYSSVVKQVRFNEKDQCLILIGKLSDRCFYTAESQ